MSILDLPEESLSSFDRTPFQFTHGLANHGGLDFATLREVVLSLPSDQVFASRADLDVEADFDRAHLEKPPERSLAATLDDMAEANAYVMVRRPDADARLRPILELFEAELRDYTLRAQGTPGVPAHRTVFHDPMLYLFISSPHSVTPFHVDRYTTFLLQLQGQKEVMVWDRFDRDTVPESELDALFGEPHVRHCDYQAERARPPRVVALEPGRGVHIPFTSPHWVKNGPEVSVSLSFICKTETTLRQADAHRFNYYARRLLRKAPGQFREPPLGAVGTRAALDAAKSRLLQGARGLKRGLPRFKGV